MHYMLLHCTIVLIIYLVLNLDTLNMIRHSTISKCKTKTEKERYLEVTNKLWRHLEYKNFISWINYWTSIDRFNRIVTPACVVTQIRERFPEANGNTGFKEYEKNEQP
jgi:hypothetical protein